MAVLTQRLCAFEDEAIVLSFDWDDTTGDIVSGRCVNDSTVFAVHVLIEGHGIGAAGRSFERTFAADSGLVEVSIPVGQRPRFPIIQPEPGEFSVDGWAMRAELL